MTTMKAALFDGKGAMELAEVARPTPGPGDAIVQIRASGVCGSDLQMNADKTEPDEQPAGHEVAGEVVEVGEGWTVIEITQAAAPASLSLGRE